MEINIYTLCTQSPSKPITIKDDPNFELAHNVNQSTLDIYFKFESTAKQRSTFVTSDLNDYLLFPHVPRMTPDLDLIQIMK